MNFAKIINKSGLKIIILLCAYVHGNHIKIRQTQSQAIDPKNAYRNGHAVDEIKKIKMQELGLQNATNSINDFETTSSLTNHNKTKTYIDLINVTDSYFYGLIRVGNPPQEFRVAFDTGSSKIWIPGNECKSLSCLQHRMFDRNLSNSYVAENSGLQIEYGAGKVEGKIGRDTIQLGPIKLNNTRFLHTEAQDHIFELPQTVFDGVFGLAIDPNKDEKLSPIHNIIDNLSIKQKLFTFELPKGHNSTGKLTFGEINQELYQVNYSKAYGNSTSFTKRSNSTALLDTGTSFILGDSWTINKLNKDMGVDVNTNRIECSAVKYLKPIKIVLDNRVFRLYPKDYILKDKKNHACYSAFMKKSDGPPLILGISFLSKFYSIFDIDKQRVGLAPIESKFKENIN
ncbi:hypothetical protein BB561_000149 [Smittium simulii]|uniref:Peptidase A1 domain-containing protein n=1 Tax=Smittium simulii TaxID=133385 RepID=A0A2T9Z0B8_9FUNG|nr:hypothetical protein BB561_000149 [Smittium simulii]